MWTNPFKEQIPSVSKSKVLRAAGENWHGARTEFGFALHSLRFFTRREENRVAWAGARGTDFGAFACQKPFPLASLTSTVSVSVCGIPQCYFSAFPDTFSSPFRLLMGPASQCLSSKEGIMLCHHFSCCSFLQQVSIMTGKKKSGSHHLCSLMTYGWLLRYYSQFNCLLMLYLNEKMDRYIDGYKGEERERERRSHLWWLMAQAEAERVRNCIEQQQFTPSKILTCSKTFLITRNQCIVCLALVCS